MTEDPFWPRATSLLMPATKRNDNKIAMIGCPLSKPSISPSNAHETPQALRKVLKKFSTFAAGCDPMGKQMLDLSNIKINDYGDLDISELESTQAQNSLLEKLISIINQNNPSLSLLIGGDNAVTRSGMKATCGNLKNAALITFDAHHDVRDYYNGPSNGTPVRDLIDDGLPGNQIAQIGIAGFTNSLTYRNYVNDNGITIYSMSDIWRQGIVTIMDNILNKFTSICEKIYIDFDIDVLDRAFVPGCPGARPGGMLPKDLHLAAFMAGQNKKIVAADFTEVDSSKDINELTLQNMALCILNMVAGYNSR